MKIKTSKALNKLYNDLEKNSYYSIYHVYTYKEANQIIRKHFEKLEKKLDNLIKI